MGARSLLEQGGEEDLRKNLRMRVLLITKVKVLQKALEGFQGLESWVGRYTEPGIDLILGTHRWVGSARFPQVANITELENVKGYLIISKQIVEFRSLGRKSRWEEADFCPKPPKFSYKNTRDGIRAHLDNLGWGSPLRTLNFITFFSPIKYSVHCFAM